MKRKSYYIPLTVKQTRRLRKLMEKVGHTDSNGAFFGQPFVFLGTSEDRGEPGLLKLQYFNKKEYHAISRAIHLTLLNLAEVTDD